MTYRSLPHPQTGLPPNFACSEREVLCCPFEQRQRRKALYQALSVGTYYGQPVVLLVEGETTCLVLSTRVIAIGIASVFIEHNQPIAMKAIHKVIFAEHRPAHGSN